MFLSGPELMCCRICEMLIGAQLQDFLRVSRSEWPEQKFVDVFCFCLSFLGAADGSAAFFSDGRSRIRRQQLIGRKTNRRIA